MLGGGSHGYHMTNRDDVASYGELLGDEVCSKPEGGGVHEEDDEEGEEESRADRETFLSSQQLCLFQLRIITVCM